MWFPPRSLPARFAVGAADYYSTPFLTGCTFPTFTGYLTTFHRIARRPNSRLLRVDVHGTMHDVTYVLRRSRVHVKTLQMMGR